MGRAPGALSFAVRSLANIHIRRRRFTSRYLDHTALMPAFGVLTPDLTESAALADKPIISLADRSERRTSPTCRATVRLPTSVKTQKPQQKGPKPGVATKLNTLA